MSDIADQQEINRLNALVEALVKERDEARERCAYDALNSGAIDAIRTACKEIMGGNVAFVDDDFARCLYTQKQRAEAAEAEVTALKEQQKADDEHALKTAYALKVFVDENARLKEALTKIVGTIGPFESGGDLLLYANMAADVEHIAMRALGEGK